MMARWLIKMCFALALLCSSALAAAQSANDADQGQDAAAASSQDQEEPASDGQAQQNQDSASQDVAQVEDEEEASAGRFIPTEQLSQDLGASFPVDI
jgi:hypothetical protein